MAYDIQEEEQAEALKRWWKEYGTSVIIGLVLAAAITLGWQWWQGQQELKAQQAGGIYGVVLSNLDTAAEAARAAAEQLVNDFPATSYADLARLALARLDFEADQRDAAQAHLQGLIEHAKDPSIALIARLRMARLIWAKGDVEGALKQLDTTWPEAFKAQADELRGDLLLTLGRVDEARAAYDSALAQATLLGQETGMIRIKRDDLGSVAHEAK